MARGCGREDYGRDRKQGELGEGQEGVARRDRKKAWQGELGEG